MVRTAYKLLRKKDGKLYPLYVFSQEETPIGVWLLAREGELASDGKSVKSRIGNLCFRPGWHLSDIPLATHIGLKDESGKIVRMHPDTVWCLCEYHDDVDYQEEADDNGWKNGRFNARNAMLKRIPVNGCYRYKTSPLMYGKWIIAGEMRLVRALSDSEVADICHAHGVEPLPR